MDSIGVRELRQHASRYLARVAEGETLQVTDRGQPVALLVPMPTDPWRALLSNRRVIPPTEGDDLLDDAAVDYRFSASERLAAMREDER